MSIEQWSDLLEREYKAGAPANETTPRTAALIHTLVMLAEPERIVEYGAHVGFTTAWLGLACRMLGKGHVHAYEIDHDKVMQAQANLLSVIGPDYGEWVTLIEGDAMLAQERDTDFLYLDIDPKTLYLKAFGNTRFRPGAILCAHDVVWDSPMLGDFIRYMRTRPDWQALVLPQERGLLIARFNP